MSYDSSAIAGARSLLPYMYSTHPLVCQAGCCCFGLACQLHSGSPSNEYDEVCHESRVKEYIERWLAIPYTVLQAA